MATPERKNSIGHVFGRSNSCDCPNGCSGLHHTPLWKIKLGFKMVKTVLKIDGMMCGMCESHMNNLIRNLFPVKKVTSSAKDGETVIISEQELDMSKLETEIAGIGYKLLSHTSEPYVKKGLFSFHK